VILESIRAVADWLAHPTYGVQAAFAALQYDAGDTAPNGVVAVYDETRREEAATERPMTVPYLRVQCGEVRSLEGQAATYTHDADIPIEILIVRSKTDADDATRDAYMTTRAVLRVIEQLFNPQIPDAVTAVWRNGVQLESILTLACGRVDTPLSDTNVTMAVLCTLRVRDTLA
jgi:hypothetical protein